MLRSFSAILFCALIALPLYAQEQPKEEKLQEKIARLITELGSDDWRVRESAQRELIDLGKVAGEALSEAAKSSDFEVRLRATKILKSLYWLSAEELKKAEELVRQFLELKLELKQADVVKSYSSIIRGLRRIKNSQHYLIDSIVEAKDANKREKLAQLLNGTEYTDPFRRVNTEANFTEDVLLTLARDGVVPQSVRSKAAKALGEMKSVLSVASLIDLLTLPQPEVNLEILNALKKIVPVDNAPTRKLPMQVNETDKQFWRDWWDKNAKSEQYSASAKDVEVRRKVEGEWAKAPSPFLGVAKSALLPEYGGAHIDDVLPNTAAFAAGLRTGDVVVEIEGRDVSNWEDLVRGIRRSKVGQKVQLKVIREGKEQTIEATLGSREQYERQ
jgi:hypothetical protein